MENGGVLGMGMGLPFGNPTGQQPSGDPDFLLLEDGSGFILLEDGSKIILEA